VSIIDHQVNLEDKKEICKALQTEKSLAQENINQRKDNKDQKVLIKQLLVMLKEIILVEELI